MTLLRRCLTAASCVLLLSLAGCASHSGDGGTSTTTLLQRAARAVLVGHAYDTMVLAARRGDAAAFLAARDGYVRFKSTSGPTPSRELAQELAEQTISNAMLLDILAQNQPANATQLHARAAHYYRQALQLSPQFDSQNPTLLNALGYFLAERGTTPADFQRAEELTRRALQLWNATLAHPNLSETGRMQLLFSHANTRDSLAWALYRQGRFEAARREQEVALQEAQTAANAGVAPVPPELYFHLGEIYRALQQNDDAIRQYQSALKVNPEDIASQRALEALQANRKKP